MTTDAGPIQTTLNAARAQLSEAERLRREALEGLASNVRAHRQVGRELTPLLLRSLAALDEATELRDDWLAVVNETARDAAIERETSDPTVAPVAVRARVEALIERHVFGSEIVHVGGETARPWRLGREGVPIGQIPHYASDPNACALAVQAIGRHRVAGRMVAVCCTGSAPASVVASNILGASCYTRAACVLDVAGIALDADPCA